MTGVGLLNSVHTKRSDCIDREGIDAFHKNDIKTEDGAVQNNNRHPPSRDTGWKPVTLELDSIDRLYLKRLRASAPTWPRIDRIPLPAPWTADRLACAPGADTGKFVAEIKGFAAQQAIPLFHFERKESKDLRAHQMRRRPKKASALKAWTMGFLVARIH